MKIISKNFIQQFGKQIINIHPSLLPKFKGLNTFSRILKDNEKKTGCTVHYVNEKLDGGNIIAKKSFFISSNDNEKTLKQKTQKLEYQIFPEAVIKIFRNN
jgi:folate-dependent phosphoribosylglycinamide formyltransferase PurN